MRRAAAVFASLRFATLSLLLSVSAALAAKQGNLVEPMGCRWGQAHQRYGACWWLPPRIPLLLSPKNAPACRQAVLLEDQVTFAAFHFVLGEVS